MLNKPSLYKVDRAILALEEYPTPGVSLLNYDYCCDTHSHRRRLLVRPVVPLGVDDQPLG